MTTTMEAVMEISTVDDIIRRLLEGKGGKQVQLSEIEIRQLCVNARQIFLSQPNLLDLHAPIRICGTLSLPLCSTDSKNGFALFLLCYYKL
ncbi:hypothetical protein HID58_010991 [Brassica napus]|uniref:protein-serine/threonine phosphatase n=1 Tax=Brassica napus TaxID=3708 RepID=A0ABQ8DWZ4_BRANA|nr:hypothetical protein HID58_010991 [Brassica napus]